MVTYCEVIVTFIRSSKEQHLQTGMSHIYSLLDEIEKKKDANTSRQKEQ